MFKVSILTIGSEILDGRINNSNAQYFGRILDINNIKIQEMLSCDDDIDLICDALEYLFKKTKYVITSGGLGPTSDDLTRDAVAKFTGQPLYLDQNLLEGIKDWYRNRNRQFIELNAVQARIPVGSTPIKNFNGTAPGFIAEFDGNSIATLPGIPRELYSMFEEQVLPDIVRKVIPEKSFQSVFRTFGIPESEVATRISSVELPTDTRIIYQVQFPEVKVILINSDSETNLKVKNSVVEAVKQDFVISQEGKDLSLVIQDLMIQNNETLSIAESCSGGLLSHIITNNPGSSAFFKGSVVCYDNQIKIDTLGVSKETIIQYGAVSEQSAVEMVNGIAEKFKTEHAIAITGVAGPDGGTEEKPIGTVWIAVKSRNQSFVKKYNWNYSREQIKQFSASQSLDILRRFILNIPQIN